jgi:hypothetical protein
MAITLTYEPNKGVSFDDTSLLWGTDRQQVRTLLNAKFEVGDNIFDLSQYDHNDTSENIIQRRDIYENYQGQNNFFFLNFDTAEQLIEVELHHGLDINLKGIVINFSMGIEKVVDLLESVSTDKIQLSEGEYFFKELKLTIANSNAKGGEGNEISYFYCCKDITHLIED